MKKKQFSESPAVAVCGASALNRLSMLRGLGSSRKVKREERERKKREQEEEKAAQLQQERKKQQDQAFQQERPPSNIQRELL